MDNSGDLGLAEFERYVSAIYKMPLATLGTNDAGDGDPASSLSWDLVPPVKTGTVHFTQLGAQVSCGADIVLVGARRSSVSSGYPPSPVRC